MKEMCRDGGGGGGVTSASESDLLTDITHNFGFTVGSIVLYLKGGTSTPGILG